MPGLGAIARATGDRELHLVRRVHAPQCALERLAHRGRVLRAEAAPLAADASLHRAQRLCVRVARRHVEVGPHRRQVRLLHAEQVDALAAGDLDRRIWYLSTTSAIRRSSDAFVSPPHMRGMTEYVPSFWMLACARSLMKRDCGSSTRLLRPRRDQVIVDRRPARRAAIGRAPFEERIVSGIDSSCCARIASRTS